MPRPILTNADRDKLAELFPTLTCPVCGRPGWLRISRPSYGWGAMGAQYACSNCRTKVRIPWSSLSQAIRRLGKS